jgi:hypothetical protein
VLQVVAQPQSPCPRKRSKKLCFSLPHVLHVLQVLQVGAACVVQVLHVSQQSLCLLNRSRSRLKKPAFSQPLSQQPPL